MIKAYASCFVSYLLREIGDERINRIILFGSVAKEEARRESDVDIFVDVRKKTNKLENLISKALSDFYKSRDGLMFKAKGIDNKINVIVGKLEEWKELRGSIESTGIVLYGPYVGGNIEGKKYTIIFWDNVKKNRGAFLNKLYGFRVKERKYKGLIEEFGGWKLGKSSIMIPVEHRSEILKLIKKYGVNAKLIEVYY